MILNIHHDCDGILRNFSQSAFRVFFKRYPEFEKYLLPPTEVLGWDWKGQFKQNAKSDELDDLIWNYIFENPKMAREAFYGAKPLVSPDEWKFHIDELKKSYPDANIVISTHQYTKPSFKATMDWLVDNEFLFNDEISVLMTGKKEKFGAHFLLDDKPSTIETFHKPYERIGVLYIQPRSNIWYVKEKRGKFKFPSTSHLAGFRKIIKKHAIELF